MEDLLGTCEGCDRGGEVRQDTSRTVAIRMENKRRTFGRSARFEGGLGNDIVADGVDDLFQFGAGVCIGDSFLEDLLIAGVIGGIDQVLAEFASFKGPISVGISFA